MFLRGPTSFTPSRHALITVLTSELSRSSRGGYRLLVRRHTWIDTGAGEQKDWFHSFRWSPCEDFLH
jgi:hypothetical protein